MYVPINSVQNILYTTFYVTVAVLSGLGIFMIYKANLRLIRIVYIVKTKKRAYMLHIFMLISLVGGQIAIMLAPEKDYSIDILYIFDALVGILLCYIIWTQ